MYIIYFFLFRASNSVSSATSVSFAQMTFYSYPLSWYPLVNIPCPDFWGRLKAQGATSQLVNSGNGLFTTIDIYKEEIIAIFKGKATLLNTFIWGQTAYD